MEGDTSTYVEFIVAAADVGRAETFISRDAVSKAELLVRTVVEVYRGPR